MIIKTDVEGKNVIGQLCDIALKQGGMQNRVQINMIMDSIELLPEPDKIDPSTFWHKEKKKVKK